MEAARYRLTIRSDDRALGTRAREQRKLIADAPHCRAYDAYSRTRPARHPDLSGPLIGLGIAYRLLGNLPESEKALREARALLQPHPDSRDRIAAAAGELGLTLRALGHTDEADALLKESYETFRAAFGDTYPLTVQALAHLTGAGASREAPAVPDISASRTPSSRRPS
jgi:tetratricopeptide (TPR) repeat protein